jgi:catechol 2,3-dioxygenase-like lactoylglutathione lyase family enzyme
MTPLQSMPDSSTATTIPRIVYFIVYVRDLSESRAFYERQLGLRLLEEDDHSAKYDAGLVMLLLNRAQDHGVSLSRPDDSAWLDFLVEDSAGVQIMLERRGVRFTQGPSNGVEAGTVFHDPNGHCLRLHQPDVSRNPVNGGKLRVVREAVLSKEQRDRQYLNGDAAGLDGAPLLHWSFAVPDAVRARKYYNEMLRLPELAGPCNHYDAGGIILAFRPHSDSYRAEEQVGLSRGIAPVFHVPDLRGMVADLLARGLSPGEGIHRSAICLVTSYGSPSGHRIYLYEPSTESMTWPSGAKIQQILSANV